MFCYQCEQTQHIDALAGAEDLPAHGDAVIARLPELR